MKFHEQDRGRERDRERRSRWVVVVDDPSPERYRGIVVPHGYSPYGRLSRSFASPLGETITHIKGVLVFRRSSFDPTLSFRS